MVTVISRALVWMAALLSVQMLGAHDRLNALSNDAPRLTAAASSVGRLLLTPLARWDSVWFLGVVQHGYAPIPGTGAQARTAFFPLYPLLVWLGSGLGASRGVHLVAAFIVSLTAFAGALYLLRRLVELELGEQFALSTLLLLAFFPGALFFGIPYSESLFLLVTVGAFYAARTGHWTWAGLCAAAASATRSTGILLVVPLVLMYLYGPRAGGHRLDRPAGRLTPRYAIRADLAWLALGAAGLLGYSVYLGIHNGDALAWKHVEVLWSRHFAGPFGGIVDGARAAWSGATGLISGSAARIYLQHGQLEPTRAAASDVVLFGFALAAVPAVVGTLRRLPIAYGVWAVLALAVPLSYPATGQPLESLPRFLAVLFPLAMWLAVWARRRRAIDLVLVVFAALLGLFAAQYAAWEFIS